MRTSERFNGTSKRSLIIITIVIFLVSLIIWLKVRTYCWNFLESSNFDWVFSTLAQVFGALLGLSLISVFFIFETLTKIVGDINAFRIENNRIRKKIRKMKDMNSDITRKIEKWKGVIETNYPAKCFSEELKELEDLSKKVEVGLDDFNLRHLKIRGIFIKIFFFIFSFFACILIYSIMILPLSHHYLIESSIIIYFFGIVIPILGVLFLVCFISVIKDIAAEFEYYEILGVTVRDFHNETENLYEDMNTKYKELEDVISAYRKGKIEWLRERFDLYSLLKYNKNILNQKPPLGSSHPNYRDWMEFYTKFKQNLYLGSEELVSLADKFLRFIENNKVPSEKDDEFYKLRSELIKQIDNDYDRYMDEFKELT